MNRIVSLLLSALVLTGAYLELGWSDELKPIHTQKTKDLVLTLRSETGQWKQGKNAFVLEFTSAATQQAVDVGKVTLNAVMPMPGMAPMLTGATFAADKTPGRYLGTISFPDSGARQITVTWDGPGGKGSAQFSLPVR